MSSAEVAAIIARIGGEGVAAWDAQPDTPTYPYCVVYADSGVSDTDREGARDVRLWLDWQTTVVGESARQCRAAADRVRGALENWAPVVASRHCSTVEHRGSQPVVRDDDMPDRVLFFAVDQWSTVSEPA